MSAYFTEDLRFLKNTDRVYSFIAKDPSGQAINLTGSSFDMEVRTKPSSEVLLSANTTNGKITMPDAANGVFQLTVSSTDLSGIEEGTYRYDIFLINPDTTKEAILEGFFIVKNSITDS